MGGNVKIYRNAIRTPDGTVLESKHRWDYVEHKDANGEYYMVDGGLSYLRGGVGHKEPPEYLHLTNENTHEEIRERFTWGTYGIKGDQPLSFVKLKDMTSGHINAVLETQKQVPEYLRDMFKRELEERCKNTSST